MRDEAIVIRGEEASDGFADDQRIETVEMGFASLVYCAVPEKPSATDGFCRPSGKGTQRLKV